MDCTINFYSDNNNSKHLCNLWKRNSRYYFLVLQSLADFLFNNDYMATMEKQSLEL